MSVRFTMEWNGRDPHVVAEHGKDLLKSTEVIEVAVFELRDLLLGNTQPTRQRGLRQPTTDALADDHLGHLHLLLIQFLKLTERSVATFFLQVLLDRFQLHEATSSQPLCAR
ncbi:MAG: hypothetical protein A3C53_02965 [Omnitrophica WOR_2 bacterium RIFCSPHIGHO2_02_FULL_68_15]|nr:MAG: hypothetical protein A3C53_02965 [Omnitrophica WOR_2 bacterium RIFCSPHIGHO2_02_FULL_68_15]